MCGHYFSVTPLTPTHSTLHGGIWDRGRGERSFTIDTKLLVIVTFPLLQNTADETVMYRGDFVLLCSFVIFQNNFCYLYRLIYPNSETCNCAPQEVDHIDTFSDWKIYTMGDVSQLGDKQTQWNQMQYTTSQQCVLNIWFIFKTFHQHEAYNMMLNQIKNKYNLFKSISAPLFWMFAVTWRVL